MKKQKSVISKLLSAACALLLAIQVMSPAAYALNGVAEGGDAASGPLYDVYQIFQCDVRLAEEADLPYLDEGVQIGDKLASNFRFGKNFSFSYRFGGCTDETLAEFEAQGVVFEVGGTYPDGLVSMDIAELMAGTDGESEYLAKLSAYVDMESEPYASGLSLSELNARTAEPGYYLIVNTPGSVTGSQGYTRGITTVTDADSGFDVIPKAVSLSLDKSVMKLPNMGLSAFAFATMVDSGFFNGNASAPAVIDAFLSAIPYFGKSVVLSISDAAVYKLSVRVPKELSESWPDCYYMLLQDMAPDGFFMMPMFLTVSETPAPNAGERPTIGTYFDECVEVHFVRDMMMNGSAKGDNRCHAWVSVAKSGMIGDVNKDGEVNVLSLLRSSWDVNVLSNMHADSDMYVTLFLLAAPSSLALSEIVDANNVATDAALPLVLDANTNNSRLWFQNNPVEQVVSDNMPDYGNSGEGDGNCRLLYWQTVTPPKPMPVAERTGVAWPYTSQVYIHSCDDTGIATATVHGSVNPSDNEPVPKQLSMGCTADSEATMANAYLPGLTIYYGTNTGNPLVGAEFMLTQGYDAESLMLAENVEPVFSQSDTGLYRKLVSGVYTPLTNLPADRYADDSLYQAHTTRPSLSGLFGDVQTVTNSNDAFVLKSVTVTTDSNGMISLAGLPIGSYRLRSSAPIQGFNNLADVYFSIGANDNGQLTASFVRPDDCLTAEGFSRHEGASDIIPLLTSFPTQENAPELVMSPDGWFYLNLIASSGVVLPTTGGAGTAAIIATGTGLLGLAIAFVLIRRRRQMAQ